MPSAATSPLSSTPPARPVARRAASSPTRTSSSSAATRASSWVRCSTTERRRCSSSPRRTSSPASSLFSACTQASRSATSPIRNSSSIPSAASDRHSFSPFLASSRRSTTRRSRRPRAVAKGRSSVRRRPRPSSIPWLPRRHDSLGAATAFRALRQTRALEDSCRHGGRVRYAVSGSAPLGYRLGHFYHSLGIKILEGYGLTETTA